VCKLSRVLAKGILGTTSPQGLSLQRRKQTLREEKGPKATEQVSEWDWSSLRVMAQTSLSAWRDGHNLELPLALKLHTGIS
jgi:hypothetical protein